MSSFRRARASIAPPLSPLPITLASAPTHGAGRRWRPRWFLCLALCLGIWLLAAGVAAQPAPPPGGSLAHESSEGERADSPRACLQKYLELSRAGRYEQAAQYLDVPASRRSERAILARRLTAVLDHHVWVDLDKMSDRPEGSSSDGLPPDLELVGNVPTVVGVSEAVRLRQHSTPPTWRFSSATVGRVDGWYDKLPDRWLLEHLPPILLRRGPRDLLWWQWLGMLGGLLVATVSGALVSRLACGVLRRIANRTRTTFDDRLVSCLRGPIALGATLGIVSLSLPLLLLYLPAEAFVHRALRGVFLADLLWLVWRLVDVAAQSAWDSPWSHAHVASRALIPLVRRAGKALVVIVAALLLLAALGYPVTSILAGLGIGGLALALASQKTVENLFGAFSLGIDQPFREGDFVRIDDLVGTVEVLGLRSTRIRTLDRTLVSIPNGRLAEMRLETFAARDRLRLACVIGLVYSTSADQMREVLAGLEGVLRQHPKIWADTVTVRFTALAATSLDIEIMAWFTTQDWSEFLLIRQEMLLAFMKVVENAGSSFAFPTQTVHLFRERDGSGGGSV